MVYKISKSRLAENELIDLPASKSLSNRALILRSLNSAHCPISHISDCDDTRVMLAAFNADSRTHQFEGNYRIIDIGAAGTSMRFLTAFFASQQGQKVIMTGSERMRQRPISILVDALGRLGADIEYCANEGFPPLRINGKQLEGGVLEIDGSVSSQYISALLMIAPTLTNGLELHLTGKVTSVPYINMTLTMMRQFGVQSSWQGNVINVAHQEYSAESFEVESDWSAASYWYEILALTSQINSIRLKGLHLDSTQGDCQIARYFQEFGIKTEACTEGVIITKTSAVLPQKVEFDMSSQPDLAQTVVATCCALGVHFHIKGLHTLRIKETDRIAALENELAKLGFIVSDCNDSEMMWDGQCNDASNQPIATYKDHRMAMAFAPLCLITQNAFINIDDPAVVSKSYPSFWNDMRQIGFLVEETK